ncbi:unnamed protein product [Calicophoron daubneyi]|uniref:Peptidase S54 rhomboid domain-containing protein n=1 Tax=Calicophoron daubneyi TaxID=300641 RepID=A0AAV2TWZ7_CALDB
MSGDSKSSIRRRVNLYRSSLSTVGFGYNAGDLRRWDKRLRSYHSRTYEKTSRSADGRRSMAVPSSAPPPSLVSEQSFPFERNRFARRSAADTPTPYGIHFSAPPTQTFDFRLDSFEDQPVSRIAPLAVSETQEDMYSLGSLSVTGEHPPELYSIKEESFDALYTPIDAYPESPVQKCADQEVSGFLSNITPPSPQPVGLHTGSGLTHSFSEQPTVTSSDTSFEQQYFPHFSWWVSCVQVIVFICALPLYGICPYGASGTRRVTGRVLMPTLSVDHVCRSEDQSPLLAQRPTDLVRLGARFAPCMRHDPIIQRDIIDRQRAADRLSGCCIRNDGGGCYQTKRAGCSHLLATWLHNNQSESALITGRIYAYDRFLDHMNMSIHTAEGAIPTNRPIIGQSVKPKIKVGPVCGLDPAFCLQPRSSGAFAWSDSDVTKWPVCEVPNAPSNLAGFAPHMECKVTGRPCCVGLVGECIITTKEHCDFLRGVYNPKAALCSQVSCLEKTCGMLGFAGHLLPNQAYRAVVSLFLHANVIHLLVSLAIQLIFMRTFEQVIGWPKMCAIYLLSGVVGNFLSLFIHPYQVQTGPSHMGVLGARLVDFIYFHHLLRDAHPGMMCNILPLVCLFLIGFLPWIDNIANIGSLIAGLLLYFILIQPMPPKFSGDLDKNLSCEPKVCWVTMVYTLVFLLFTTAVCVLFFLFPNFSCGWCKHLTCAPFASNLCYQFETNGITRSDCIHNHW